MNWIPRKPTEKECDSIGHMFATIKHDGNSRVVYDHSWAIYEDWKRWNMVAWMPFEFPEPSKGEA